MKNADMPISVVQNSHGAIMSTFNCDQYTGLTKREYFAGLAMQGILISDAEFTMDKNDIAFQAVRHADALLAELERTK